MIKIEKLPHITLKQIFVLHLSTLNLVKLIIDLFIFYLIVQVSLPFPFRLVVVESFNAFQNVSGNAILQADKHFTFPLPHFQL